MQIAISCKDLCHMGTGFLNMNVHKYRRLFNARVRRYFCSLMVMSVTTLTYAAENPIKIIPEPAQLTHREGVFTIGRATYARIKAHDSLFQNISRDFLTELRLATGYKLLITDSVPDSTTTYFEIAQIAGLPKESYRMDISLQCISISASDGAGLFYAFQSLRQLLPLRFHNKKRPSGTSVWTVPCVGIFDYPRFAYRGMHLDVSRHFFTLGFLKKYIDILAFYKLNTFHWHLTDNEGWRVEIKKYPRLTSTGAWRTETPMNVAKRQSKDKRETYGGFYTQEQIRELVDYAARRFITIIPQIEMPGNCTAALVAYPEYACLDKPVPLQVPAGHISSQQYTFCAGNDSTFSFLENILDEVTRLFPSQQIHIGTQNAGDSSRLGCSRCRKKMEELHLTTQKELQGYFTKRIAAHLTGRNKRAMAWDDGLEAGASPGIILVSREVSNGISAAKDSNEVVMAPKDFVFFDRYQSAPGLEPDISFGGLFLNKVYSFDPAPEEITGKEVIFIQGAQGCLWTENIRSPERAEYMLLPRLLALSEALWTPAAGKNYKKFVDKVEQQFQVFDAKNIRYSRSLYNVSIDPISDSAGRVKVLLHSQTGSKYLIRYNLTGKPPSALDPIYAGPVNISSSATIKAALFKENTILGKVTEDRLSIHAAAGSKAVVIGASVDSMHNRSILTLSDGIHGTLEPNDGRWLIFTDSSFSLKMDLGKGKLLGSVSVRFLEDVTINAYLPNAITVKLSYDGESFDHVYLPAKKIVAGKKPRQIVSFKKDELNKSARFVQVDIKLSGGIDRGNSEKKRVLLDEIVVE